jgi:hypothetical protein
MVKANYNLRLRIFQRKALESICNIIDSAKREVIEGRRDVKVINGVEKVRIKDGWMSLEYPNHSKFKKISKEVFDERERA